MAIRTSSSASSRNRKKRINRSSRSPESMSPRWSRDSSRSRNRPSGGRGDGSCGLGGGPPGGGLPGDESPPGGGDGGSDGGGGGGRPETGPGAGSCWGMRLYAPCSLRMYRLYTLSLPFRQEFFPQMDEPCQMCRPFHLALLFRLQKRPQGVQQLHGGAVAAAIFLCQRQKLPQQRRVQSAQSSGAAGGGGGGSGVLFSAPPIVPESC